MKFLILTMCLLSFSAFAFEKVKINGQVYVADGFDDNDLVEVTVPYTETINFGMMYEGK
jgi:hypothetical protein